MLLDGTAVGCGDPDVILVRSVAPGVPQPWTGAGVFDVVDVDAADQSCALGLVIDYGGGNSGNCPGWVFAGCPTDVARALPASLSLSPVAPEPHPAAGERALLAAPSRGIAARVVRRRWAAGAGPECGCARRRAACDDTRHGRARPRRVHAAVVHGSRGEGPARGGGALAGGGGAAPRLRGQRGWLPPRSRAITGPLKCGEMSGRWTGGHPGSARSKCVFRRRSRRTCCGESCLRPVAPEGERPTEVVP